MPINVQCSCGKRMGLSDALAGKTIKCPACGDAIHVPAVAPSGAGKEARRANPASPAIYISTGKIVALASIAVAAILGIMFYIGPVRRVAPMGRHRAQGPGRCVGRHHLRPSSLPVRAGNV